MPGPEVIVKTQEVLQAAGTSLSTGTAFVAAPAAYGPEEPLLVKSLGEAEASFGVRKETESQKLFDWLNTYFSTGGQRAYVNRMLGAGIAFAKEELETAAKTKVLVIKAKYKGTQGNALKIEVASGGVIVFNENGEELEKSGAKTKASEVLEYFEKHKALVTVEEGSNYATGKTEELKVLAKKALAGGVNPTVTEAEAKKALEGFGKALGPGQLAAVGAEAVKSGVQKAMAELAQERNRLALIDLKEAETKNVTVATLKGEIPTLTTAQSTYVIMASSTVIVQGVTAGTTRTVPASAAIAGLRARVSQTANDNQTPAGPEPRWSLAPFVTGITNTFTQAQIVELATAGINSFKEPAPGVALWGLVTACSQEKDKIYWQFAPSAERMSLLFKAEQIAEGYLFKTISNRLINKYKSDLAAMGLEQYKLEALFSSQANNPQEAFIVNVGEPINTLTTIQAGELNAEMVVRISPSVNLATVIIVSVPVTEQV